MTDGKLKNEEEADRIVNAVFKPRRNGFGT